MKIRALLDPMPINAKQVIGFTMLIILFDCPDQLLIKLSSDLYTSEFALCTFYYY